MRVRIVFEKTKAMRFTSHLDLHRTWERTIRRADLPLTYSQGYNPRPRITLATALPLGFTSDAEVIEIHLDDEMPLGEILSRVRKSSPPGIICREIFDVQNHSPKVPNLVDTAEYQITIPGKHSEIGAKIVSLLKQDEVIRERRGKEYDLRPRIFDLRVQSHDPEQTILQMELGASQDLTGRPDEVLLELGIDPNKCLIHRTELKLINH